MKDINGKGIFAGLIAWGAFIWMTVDNSACLRSDTCGGGDMALFAIIGVGMLAPAWIAAIIVSALFDR